MLAITGQRSVRLYESLIRGGAHIHMRNCDLWTVLHFSVLSSSLNALRFFISKGSDVNSPDAEGYTPLHGALFDPDANAHQIIDELLKAGADIKSVNKLQQTPLSLALEGYENGKIAAETYVLLGSKGAVDKINVNL